VRNSYVSLGTGGMRRTHLRGHTNILKRLLIHACGFNLGLRLRTLLGAGTPRGLQDFGGRAVAAVLDPIHIVHEPLTVRVVSGAQFRRRAIRIACLRRHPLSPPKS
jgi:hypothetical protein